MNQSLRILGAIAQSSANLLGLAVMIVAVGQLVQTGLCLAHDWMNGRGA